METKQNRPLAGQVAVVAGGTRGAGRGTAVELGAAGATVYVTGRSTRHGRSAMNRPETIEETAERVTAAGGEGVALGVDHSRSEDVAALADRVLRDHGRLDVLVNDVWGGDPLTEWDTPFWRLDVAKVQQLWQQAVVTHLLTSQHLVPLMLARHRGLVVEITDGTGEDYRGSLGYDLVKTAVNRLAFAMAEELGPHGVTALAVTPGFLRSEAMLEIFGVTEATWRDGARRDPHFAASETPHFVGRAIAALAADPDIAARAGLVHTSWDLGEEYGLTDIDGRRPHWGRHIAASAS
ncbi:NAD(P)-dependent dehydrogenase, short-chain alcohol dehydrogenase family [Geodermatophilus amargosae]|uniref:NAD(P)-dependent dehydrogenase, short-chain alcohol dehydrogenase family n=1 Tax=Geodermatophilus amargosae TaxID=1296565 RepID=A0A1I7BK77_9ACTN|nr:SDR family oxidoreductase [Geodermatophilus amargosae]SFT87584.1 NAD(P)-dependent dehydrogenase, short-chain alcohol dehydrogenase family [Geodermatophilus amargosae]